MDSLVNDLPRDRSVAIVTSLAACELVEDGVTEIQTGGAGRIPRSSSGRAGATALAAVADKEWQVGRNPVDGNDNFLSAVLVQIFAEQGVVHGDDVVGVDGI